MKNFIPAVRTDRFREMSTYEKKGYTIQDRRKYLKIDTIELEYMRKTYIYGIEVTSNEVYFYINRDHANIYFSIIEIYEILMTINKKDRMMLIEAMEQQLEQNGEEMFKYREIEYKRAQLIELKENGKVMVPESGMEITYSEIFILINLIQEKSNALFMRSTTGKKKYKNGILRLLIVLCKMEKNIRLLWELGWNWNELDGRFEYLPKKKSNTRAKYKYYLTADEYDTIMGIKKS